MKISPQELLEHNTVGKFHKLMTYEYHDTDDLASLEFIKSFNFMFNVQLLLNIWMLDLESIFSFLGENSVRA